MPDVGLYVIATPIGNLEDISYRAVRILSEVQLIAAEDTRHSRTLLSHYQIDTPMCSLHQHNEDQRTPEILQRIRAGEAVALISDAGTPLVSDPGFRLVRAAADDNLPVYTVPGASAVTAALSISGLPSDRFQFEGFLPARPAARRKRVQGLRFESATLVFFESSHRVLDLLKDAVTVFGGNRSAVICREMTKQFETVLRDDLDGLVARVEADANQKKGEFVVLVHGSEESSSDLDGLQLARALCVYLPASQAAKVAAQFCDQPRRDIYAQLAKDENREN